MSNNPSTPVVTPPDAKHHMSQDPSPLVTQMIQREVSQVYNLHMAELNAVQSSVLVRLDAMDKALSKVEQYPTDVDIAINRVREFFQEKFSSIETRFHERDKLFNMRNVANKELIQEQQESAQIAINKSEAAMQKQIEAMTTSLRDVKERMDRSDGKTEGAIRLWGTIVTAVMLAGVVAGIATAFMTRVPSIGG